MARRPASASFVFRRPEQLEAIVSPVRQEILDVVASAGPCTVAQIGEWLGRRPDTLYYHIAALVRAGLLLESGRRRTGRRFGAVYATPGRPMRIGAEAAAAGGDVLLRVIGAALRLAQRDFRRALERGEAVLEGPRRNLWGGRVKGWIDAEDLREANELIARLHELVQRGQPRSGAAPQSFTFVFTPVTTASRRQPARRGRTGRSRRSAS